MIVYELRCGAGHGFEAWFRNSETYDQQQAAHQIACPLCGDAGVSKAPMAPRIARSRGSEPAPGQEKHVAGPRMDGPGAEQLRMMMGKIAELNKHIADTCDYVGNAFAEEARKIHYGEVEHREIYGEASPADAAALREEGISVATLPMNRRNDS